jgi:hypothetical protein
MKTNQDMTIFVAEHAADDILYAIAHPEYYAHTPADTLWLHAWVFRAIDDARQPCIDDTFSGGEDPSPAHVNCMCNMENTKSTPNKELGIWTLPATIGAVRLATESSFQPAHYDAVERAVRRIGGDQITRQDVSNIKLAIDTYEAAICKQCGRFHMYPACQAKLAEK